MLSRYKNSVESRLGFAKHLSWINPNALSIIGIIPQFLFFYFMSRHMFGWSLVMIILSPLDMLDGLVARSTNQVTAFGGFLDSTLDRLSDFLLIAGFYAAGLISVTLAAVLLCSTFLISYIRSRAELASLGKIKFNQGLVERPERIIFLLAVLLIKILFPQTRLISPLITILAGLSILTVLQRFYSAYKKL